MGKSDGVIYLCTYLSKRHLLHLYNNQKKLYIAAVFNFFLYTYYIILINFKWIFVCSHSNLFYLKQICLEDIQNAKRKSKEKLFKQDFFRIIWTWFFISVTYPFALQSTESGRSVGSMVGSNKFVLVLLCTIRPFITRANSSLVYKTKEICQIRNLNWLSQRMNYFQT